MPWERRPPSIPRMEWEPARGEWHTGIGQQPRRVEFGRPSTTPFTQRCPIP